MPKRVKGPATDKDRGLYFWATILSDGTRLQLGNRVTEHTPNWCAEHRIAFATRCSRCLCRKKPELKPRKQQPISKQLDLFG